MTTTMKKISIVLLSIALVFALIGLFTVPTVGADPAWSGDYAAATEGNETVYTATHNGVAGLTCSDTVGNNNKISFSFRPNQANFGWQDAAHLTLYLDVEGGHVSFKIMHYWRALTVIVYNQDYSAVTAELIAPVNYADNEGGNWDSRADLWYDVSIEFNAYEMLFTVAGATFKANNPGYDFTNAPCHFGSWACAPSVKNMTFSTVSGWYGVYNRSTEGSDAVYTAPSGDLNRNYYIGDTTGYNQIEFDCRPNEYFSGFDTSNLTFAVTNGTQTLSFVLWHYYKAFLYYSDDNQIGVANYVTKVDGWTDHDKWYHFMIHFESSTIAVYCNGNRVYSTGSDWYMNFNDLTMFFSSWGCAPSVKNMTLSQATAPDGWYGNYNGTVVNGEETYAAHSKDFTRLDYKGNLANVNTVEFSFTLSEDYLNDTQNVSFYFTNGEQGMGIALWNFWKALFLRMYNGDLSTMTGELAVTNYPVKTDSWTGYDVWYNVKMIFAPKAIYIYINDVAYITSCVDYEMDFDDLSFCFTGYGSWDTIKNIKLYNTANVAIPHHAVTDVAVAPDCTHKGLTEGSHCDVCGDTIVAQEEVVATGHAWGAVTFAWTKTENGYTATATRVCANNAEHTETVDATVTAVTDPATCEAAGKITYTATATLGGTQYNEDKVVNLPATGHVWGEPVFTWTKTEDGYTATATRVCATDETHTETVDATVTAETTSAACEADGTLTYTATADFGDAQYSEQKTETIPATGHVWGEVTFEWTATEDGYTATATRVCANDATHTETVTATVVKGTNEDGKAVYTATVTFGEQTFTAEKPYKKIVKGVGCGSAFPAPAAILAILILALAVVTIKKRSLAK